MDKEPVSTSLLLRFCDSFLHERSIRWLLALGVLILLGSSLLLVTIQWHHATPIWKYVIFLGYTVALCGCGEWTYHRLGLRRTGTVLLALTLLLVPILFLSLDWGVVGTHAGAAARLGLWDALTRLGLGGATLAFSVMAAGRILRHFLCGTQPTFVACYHVLAVAGAMLPWLPDGSRPVAALALWAVFAVGTMKVNRHVFWVTEEHRKPRIFGFFPMALLGAQFLSLYVLFAASQVTLDALGVGIVLVAVPVLAAGDAVARVFQQRTGDLVRPLPWSIVAPLGIGLSLCAAGVCLAATGLVAPPHRGHALVFAAGITAGLMALVARRTGKTAFVWAMLVALTLTYQFSPAFFLDVVKTLARHGAALVREQRLPFAFYGLTYLPLLAGLMAASAWLARRNPLFARPMRLYSIGVACLLLALSVSHGKAMFPVGLVMTVVFAVQVALYRNRWLTLTAVAAWMLSAFGFADFLGLVWMQTPPAGFRLTCLAFAAVVVQLASRWVDPWLARLAQGSGAFAQRQLELLSFLLTAGLACYCLGAAALMGAASGWVNGVLLALVLIHRGVRRPESAVRVPAFVLVNAQALALILALLAPHWALMNPNLWDMREALLPIAAAAALSTLLWCLFGHGISRPWPLAVDGQVAAMRVVIALALAGSLTALPALTSIEALLAVFAFALAMLAVGVGACRCQSELRGWLVVALGAAGAAYLAWFRVFQLGSGIGMFVVLGVAVLLWLGKEAADRQPWTAALVRPFAWTAFALPAAAVGLGVYRHFAIAHPQWLGTNSLALLLAAGFYFWRGVEDRVKHLLLAAGVVLNIALVLLWRELAWSDPQCFMIPIGITLLAMVQLFKGELPEWCHDPLHYVGALVILVSPIFHIADGWSWLHLFTLMLASVGVVVVAIGLRVRALMYTGTAFLVADLIAMVARGSFDNANVLWLAGLALGTGVLALGAACERNREAVVDRMRVLTDALRQWN